MSHSILNSFSCNWYSYLLFISHTWLLGINKFVIDLSKQICFGENSLTSKRIVPLKSIIMSILKPHDVSGLLKCKRPVYIVGARNLMDKALTCWSSGSGFYSSLNRNSFNRKRVISRIFVWYDWKNVVKDINLQAIINRLFMISWWQREWNTIHL